ncbi:hypothetical protein JRO89_XS13G0159800 [Xanthoceras sorbifolium]|uniref:Histone deacetylase complex subunit SAP30 Sin3 binding domain-containing protein n=1 Tax=Xanthoceras sorbifolium TaxID=99658 RepID=A0ABQ8H8J9_9ROSI|nr:hypothetical protein JRO89_XS13G0159800 [Xanthoceras sorbifolium]
MLEPELCSSRGILSPFREESGDEELSVLPRHTKVIVTGNNRTKSVLVGLQGVVKKAVGLGGWHWLVLKNGVEVKLQRNALSVLEHPTGNEVDEDHDFDSSSGSDIGEKDHDFSSSIEFHKLSKPRVRQTRPWVSSTSGKGANRGSYRDVQSIIHTPHLVRNLRKDIDINVASKYSIFLCKGELGQTGNKCVAEILQTLQPCARTSIPIRQGNNCLVLCSGILHLRSLSLSLSHTHTHPLYIDQIIRKVLTINPTTYFRTAETE